MIKALKSVFNYETILSSFIGAIGYGIGYNLPARLNFGPYTCIAICMVFGTVFDCIAEDILSKKEMQQTKNKLILAAVVYILYLFAWLLVDYFLDYDLDFDFLSNIEMLLVFQVTSLLINKIKEYFNRRKEIA